MSRAAVVHSLLGLVATLLVAGLADARAAQAPGPAALSPPPHAQGSPPRRGSDAAARRERRATRSRFRRLSDARARQTARDAFGDSVTQPLWRPPAVPPGGRIAEYRNDRVAVIDLPGSDTNILVDSSVPLLAEDESGQKKPTRLELMDEGAWIAPANAPAPSRFGESLGRGFSLQDLGITIHPELMDAQAPAEAVGERLIYANAATDTDVIVGAAPLGFQLEFQLRSDESPESVRLAVDGDGLSLRDAADGSGSVEILRAGSTIARIAPPAAMDAEGTPVPASYRVDGDVLEVSFPHRDKDLAYPLLVDPYVLDNQMWTRPDQILNWSYGATYPYYWPSNGGAWGTGLYVVSGAPGYFYPHVSFGWWYYGTPGTSHAFRADFYNVIHIPGQGQNPTCYSLGMLLPGGGDWIRTGKWEIRTGGSGAGPAAFCNVQVGTNYITCVNTSCTADHSRAGDYVAFQQWAYGDGVRSNATFSFVGGVQIYVEDYDVPRLAEAASASPTSGPDAAWNVAYGQSGLGVLQFSIDSPTYPGWDQRRTWYYPCWGAPWSRCGLSGTVGATYGDLPPGNQIIRVRATSATGRVGTWTKTVNIPYYWTSWRYGGADHSINTSDELATLRSALDATSPANAEALFTKLSPPDLAWVLQILGSPEASNDPADPDDDGSPSSEWTGAWGLTGGDGNYTFLGSGGASGRFATFVDRVHWSSSVPPALASHGWWKKISGPATLADVTVTIEQHWDGRWKTVATGTKRVKSGGGRGRRATARVSCVPRDGTFTYRSVADVDIVGYSDSPEQAASVPWEVGCSALGNDDIT